MRTLSLFLLAFLLIQSLESQSSGRAYRKSNIIGSNRVTAVVGNWGVVGQPGDRGNRGAWPVANNGYIGDLSFFVGVEIPGTSPALHSVVTCPVARPTARADEDPNTGEAWTFEPVSGFFNPGQNLLASSIDKATWPSFWPDHPDWKDSSGNAVWHGFNGAENPAADQELFFVVDDNNDRRFNYSYNNSFGVAFKPDSLNPTRNGLGLRVAVRYLEFSHPLLQDIVYAVYDIKNEGTQNYSKVFFGQLMGTYVGVTSTEDFREYADDVTILFKANNIAISSDYGSSIANPLWTGPAGMLGHAFVSAPSGNRIASYDCFAPANKIRMGDDETLWQSFIPGTFQTRPTFQDTLHPLGGEDADYTMGTEYFPLAAGGQMRIAVVLAYGYSNAEVEAKVQLARVFWNRNLDLTSLLTSCTLVNFQTSQAVSGITPVQWTSTVARGTADIWFSSDEQTWTPVAIGIPNTGYYAGWNTLSVPDCAFGRLRLLIRDSSGAAQALTQSNAWFSVNNAGNGVPTVRIIDPPQPGSPPLTSDSIEVTMLLGDPEAQPLILSTSFRSSPSLEWTLFDARVIESRFDPQKVPLPVAGLPNTPDFSLKFVLSDGSLTSTALMSSLNKQTPRPVVSGNAVLHAAGESVASYEFRVVDRSKLTGDTYVVTFNDTSVLNMTTYSVWNKTRSVQALAPTLLLATVESPPFDGLTFYNNNIVTHVNPAGVRWRRQSSGLLVTQWWPVESQMSFPTPSVFHGYRSPCDYRVTFSNTIVDTSIALPEFFVPATPMWFTVRNTTTNIRVPVVWFDNGPWNWELYLVEEGPGTRNFTWNAFFGGTTGTAEDSLRFTPGDTLFITTTKGFSHRDTIVVSGNVVGVDQPAFLPGSTDLRQNFPNPFNPTTVVGYQLSTFSTVNLKVYDMLGREVATLVNGERPAGYHNATFDASRLASGVYFSVLRAGNIIRTRKMLLLR